MLAFDCQDKVIQDATVSGNLFESPLPTGADVISLVRVLHDHDDENILLLLHKVWEALPSKGTLLIAEPMAGISDAKAVGSIYFVFYLLAMKSGKPRSPETLHKILDKIFKIDESLAIVLGRKIDKHYSLFLGKRLDGIIVYLGKLQVGRVL